jgi:hypothetical protein
VPREAVRDAVERDALRVVVLLRAVLRLLVPLLRLAVLLELLFVAVAMWLFPLVASQGNDISSKSLYTMVPSEHMFVNPTRELVTRSSQIHAR